MCRVSGLVSVSVVDWRGISFNHFQPFLTLFRVRLWLGFRVSGRVRFRFTCRVMFRVDIRVTVMLSHRRFQTTVTAKSDYLFTFNKNFLDHIIAAKFTTTAALSYTFLFKQLHANTYKPARLLLKHAWRHSVSFLLQTIFTTSTLATSPSQPIKWFNQIQSLQLRFNYYSFTF